MSEAEQFVIRTEDLLPEEVLDLYVKTDRDERLVSLLMSKTPLVVEGSRGTGKSLLLRVCEQRQLAAFQQERVLPVYVNFIKSSLLDTGTENQFVRWMLSRLASAILRALRKRGMAPSPSRALDVLAGGTPPTDGLAPTRLEMITAAFERSYLEPKVAVDDSAVPSIEAFRDAVEDICEEIDLRRINVLFDEAAHIFRPQQQRQFFTLFRDLRSPRMTCNAAVYPGVTAYGGVFEGNHDARIEQLARDLNSPEYAAQMREIVMRQASPSLKDRIEKNGEAFDGLAYAVSGNPRVLLKTVAKAGRLGTGAVNQVIKDFFRVEVWSEHSGLATRFLGHKTLIDWGRDFIEQIAIPEAKKKNDGWRERATAERSNVIWVSREAPAAAREALRLLTYTGILSRMDDGIKGTGSRIGARYAINVGCLVAGETTPLDVIKELRRHNTTKRFTEFGAASSRFQEIADAVGTDIETDLAVSLGTLLSQPVTKLDLTGYQMQGLESVGLRTIRDVLGATERDLQQIRYVGPKRSRHIMNVVTSAALEYLSG